MLNSQGSIRRGKVAISLTSHYHFHLLHKHLDISWAITADSLPLHIASSWTQTRNLIYTYVILLRRKKKCSYHSWCHGNIEIHYYQKISSFYDYALFRKLCTPRDSEPAKPLNYIAII